MFKVTRVYKIFSIDDTQYLEISSRRDIALYMHDKFGENYDILQFTFPGVIKIREGTVSVMQLFANNSRFNSPIILPYGLVSCEAMLSGCTEFNFPVILPSTMVNCADMLKGCLKFNQPLNLPYGVTNCERMLKNCAAFNQSLEIPMTVDNSKGIHEMLYGCKTMQSPVIFRNNPLVLQALYAIGSTPMLSRHKVYLEGGVFEDYIESRT